VGDKKDDVDAGGTSARRRPREDRVRKEADLSGRKGPDYESADLAEAATKIEELLRDARERSKETGPAFPPGR